MSSRVREQPQPTLRAAGHVSSRARVQQGACRGACPRCRCVPRSGTRQCLCGRRRWTCWAGTSPTSEPCLGKDVHTHAHTPPPPLSLPPINVHATHPQAHYDHLRMRTSHTPKCQAHPPVCDPPPPPPPLLCSQSTHQRAAPIHQCAHATPTLVCVRPPVNVFHSAELAMAYFDLIGQATNDSGLSVRKRAVKV